MDTGTTPTATTFGRIVYLEDDSAFVDKAYIMRNQQWRFQVCDACRNLMITHFWCVLDRHFDQVIDCDRQHKTYYKVNSNYLQTVDTSYLLQCLWNYETTGRPIYDVWEFATSEFGDPRRVYTRIRPSLLLWNKSSGDVAWTFGGENSGEDIWAPEVSM